MLPNMDLYLANRQKYLANRPKFPLEELARYAGRWIAWSPDGTRVLANSPDPLELDRLIKAAGEDPLMCVVEGIPEEDAHMGASSEAEIA